MTTRFTVKETVTASTNKMLADLKQIPTQAARVFIENTPKRTGNARRSTRLRGNTIDANYAYADRLNEGWSRQSPDGMWAPTESFIRRQLNRLGRA